MAARIVSLAPVRGRIAAPAPTALGLPQDLTGRRLHFWVGASGRRYVHHVYGLIECPALPPGLYLLVRTEQGQNRPDNPCPAANLNHDCFPQGTGGKSSRWVRGGLVAAFDRNSGVLMAGYNQTPEATGCGLIGQGGKDCGEGNGAVKAIVIDPIRGYLYASGTFSDLGGQLGLYAANLADGSFTSWQPNIDFPGFDLDLFKGDNFQTLFVAAGGAGGHLMAYKPHTANTNAVWDRRFDGDSTAVDSSQTTVYSGGHYDFVDGGAYRRKHAAAFSVDGAVAVNWDPEVDTNTGVFCAKVIPGANGMVIFGGEFSRVNRRPQPGYAEFLPLPGRQP